MRRLLPVAMASMLFLNCGGSGHTQVAAGGHASTGGAGGAASGGARAGGASGRGGASGSGGSSGAGGASSSGGTSETGGGKASGGSSGAGGASASGGSSGGAGGGKGSEGSSGAGGVTGSGGASHTGGATGSGGASGTGGASRAGGATGQGGATGTGGVTGGGGTTAAGGTKGAGGASGAGGSTGDEANTVQTVLDSGPQNIGYVNGLFVTVTLCKPGTSTCQSIDHVLVDTGSYGLRVLESAITLSLPAVNNASGNPMGSCTQFVDGTAWGPILSADVKIGGETAAAIPFQAIGENAYPMPTAGTCSSGPAITDMQSLMANGIIGVGIGQQDCGAACTQTSRNPGMYFACTSNKAGGCKTTAVPLESQVINPIVSFAVDNNGVVIQLPNVPTSGVASTTGKLIFGIGTQANNGLGNATVITPVDDYGNIGTTFPVGGTKYTGFVDSGTNMYTFLNSATSGLTLCTSAGMSSLYCPSTPKSLSATIFGGNNASVLVSFTIANPSKISASVAVLGTLGSEMPGFPSSGTSSVPDFLWGLPFFFGRTVYTAIENKDTPGGQGPYVAF